MSFQKLKSLDKSNERLYSLNFRMGIILSIVAYSIPFMIGVSVGLTWFSPQNVDQPKLKELPTNMAQDKPLIDLLKVLILNKKRVNLNR